MDYYLVKRLTNPCFKQGESTIPNQAYRLDILGSGEKSAMADNNIVVINNSQIGTFGGRDMPVFGGYSFGEAKNNIVAIENSTINGNVYGGMELLGQTQATPEHRRQLHSNLVSLLAICRTIQDPALGIPQRVALKVTDLVFTEHCTQATVLTTVSIS